MARFSFAWMVVSRSAICLVSAFLGLFAGALSAGAAEHPDPLPVADAIAATETEMKPYVELIEHTNVKFEMVPIHGGTVLLGSPESEDGRNDSEGPQHEAAIRPFWMGKYEVRWDEYDIWMDDIDVLRRQAFGKKKGVRDELADEYQISQPTEPFCDMTFGMGRKSHPAICMTQLAARTYCQWLTAKTGRYYRLPTEAEWEYACRAGATTAYHFGDDVEKLGEYAWFYDNSDEKYQKVGLKKPNPWGLYDMHGNVGEWVLDQFTTDFYGQSASGQASNPLAIPKTLFPRVVRGGSWDDDAPELRSAARAESSEEWKEQDPQVPKSIWYHTDALGVGFRLVRPLTEPSKKEKSEIWDKAEPVQDRKAVD